MKSLRARCSNHGRASVDGVHAECSPEMRNVLLMQIGHNHLPGIHTRSGLAARYSGCHRTASAKSRLYVCDAAAWSWCTSAGSMQICRRTFPAWSECSLNGSCVHTSHVAMHQRTASCGHECCCRFTQWLLVLKHDSMPRTGQLSVGQLLPDTGSLNTYMAGAQGVSTCQNSALAGCCTAVFEGDCC
jgi:hypothetical protein